MTVAIVSQSVSPADITADAPNPPLSQASSWSFVKCSNSEEYLSNLVIFGNLSNITS